MPDSEDEIVSQEFIEFIDLNLKEIIIFEWLPIDFINHPKRKDYMINLDLTNFSVLFKQIKNNLGQSITKVFSEKMSLHP